MICKFQYFFSKSSLFFEMFISTMFPSCFGFFFFFAKTQSTTKHPLYNYLILSCYKYFYYI